MDALLDCWQLEEDTYRSLLATISDVTVAEALGARLDSFGEVRACWLSCFHSAYESRSLFVDFSTAPADNDV